MVAGLSRVDPWLLAASAGLGTLTFPLRLVRWRLMLRGADDRPFGWAPLWHAVAIGFMANNLLPARAGEVARAWVARRETDARFTTALSSIAVERIFDGLVMLALMALAIAAPSFPARTMLGDVSLAHVAAWSAVVFAGALVVAFFVVLRPEPWLRAFERAVNALLPARFAAKLDGVAEGLVAGLGVLKRPGRFLGVVWWSLVLWLVNALSFAVCFRAFGLPVPAAGALLIQGIIGFGVALPAAPGFFGVFEWAAQYTLKIYGIGASLGLAYAFAYHLSGFVPITLLGLYSLTRIHLRLGDLRAAGSDAPAAAGP